VGYKERENRPGKTGRARGKRKKGTSCRKVKENRTLTTSVGGGGESGCTGGKYILQKPGDGSKKKAESMYETKR